MPEDQQYQYDAILTYQGPRRVFVETGTAVGETTLWSTAHFDRIVTIEYDYELYRGCLQKFWPYPGITIIHGDSAEWISDIEYMVNAPAVWWLDAHNVGDGAAPSGETPIMAELRGILPSHRDHVVLVDDARLFNGMRGYPGVVDVQRYARSLGYSCNQEFGDVLVLRRSHE